MKCYFYNIFVNCFYEISHLVIVRIQKIQGMVSFQVVVQSLSYVLMFATPWTAAHPAFPSFTVSQRLLKLISIELVMLSNHLILYHPLLLLPSTFPSIKVFSNKLALISGGLSIGASASASALLKIIQGWFPLGLNGLISLQSKGFSRVFSSTSFWKNQFFGAQSSLWSNSHIPTWVVEKL